MDGSIVQSLTQEPDRTEASVRFTTKLRIFRRIPHGYTVGKCCMGFAGFIRRFSEKAGTSDKKLSM